MPVRHTDLWVGGQQDARLSAVDACFPGACGADDSAVLVLLGVLAQVPEVALLVLRVPVVGVLDDLPVLADDVVHHAGLDAHDVLRLVGHRDDHPLRGAFGVGLAVDPAAAGGHGPVRVVDRAREVVGVQRHVLGPQGKRTSPGGERALGSGCRFRG